MEKKEKRRCTYVPKVDICTYAAKEEKKVLNSPEEWTGSSNFRHGIQSGEYSVRLVKERNPSSE